jgi:uncharacterized Zn finger protein (UPF0148 family)
MSDILAEVRAELAALSRADNDRRVACPVCGHRTANIAAHEEAHGGAS